MKFQIPFRRILAGSSLGVLSLFASVTISMLMMPYIVANVGDRMYGLWIFLASFIGYYGMLDLGLSVAVTRFASKSFGANNLEEANKILITSSVFFFGLGLTIAGLTTISIFIVPLYLTDPQELVDAQLILATVAITSLFQFGLRGCFGMLYARIRHDIIHIINIVKLIIRTVLIVYFVESGYGVVAIATIVMATELVGYVLDIFYMVRVFPEARLNWSHFQPGIFKEMLKYGAFSMITQLSDLARTRMVPLIVTSVVGLNAVVFYSIATRLLEIFQQSINTLMGTLTPVFSSLDGVDDERRIRQTFVLATRINLVLGFVFASGLAIFSRPFINVWMGSEYVVAANIVLIMGIGYVLSLAQEAGKILAFGISKHQKLSVFTLVESSAAAICGFWFGHVYGFLGVAIGLAVPIVLADLFVRPYLICQTIGFSVAEYYKISGEIILKIGTPTIVFYFLIKDHLEPSFTLILTQAIALVMFLVPFMYWCLNAEGKRFLNTRIFSKLPLLGGIVNAKA